MSWLNGSSTAWRALSSGPQPFRCMETESHWLLGSKLMKRLWLRVLIAFAVEQLDT